MVINVTGISPMDGANPISRISTYPSTPNSGVGQVKAETPESGEPGVKLSLSPEAQKLLKRNQQSNESGASKSGSSARETQLSKADEQTIRQLQTRDLHVKMHEQQHMASAGAYAKGGATFQYQTGPDGKAYAIGGEVQLDTSPIANNPQATITKAQIIRSSALAPADPSGADRAIAASATQMEAEARMELQNKTAPKNGTQSGSTTETAGIKRLPFQFKAYQKIANSFGTGQLVNFNA